ncbi:hypothetical protein MT997_17070 [Paenibacillus sp. OVF10]|nr:hypothetical protein MT997_17070 [Paenibacillus sp. OVF10]
MAEEEQKTVISRTILNETGQPIGTIDLYHIEHQTGFLATWIGSPFLEMGIAKEPNQPSLLNYFWNMGLKRYL